jgi:hypothetical protein
MEIEEKILAELPRQEPAPADRPVPPPLAGEGGHAPHRGGGMPDTSSIETPRR